MELTYPTRRLIRTDGSTLDFDGPRSHAEIRVLLGCDSVDTVRLQNGHVMIVDDVGFYKDLPVNAIATELYLARCVPGHDWQIRGDVVIVPDADFALPNGEPNSNRKP